VDIYFGTFMNFCFTVLTVITYTSNPFHGTVDTFSLHARWSWNIGCLYLALLVKSANSAKI